MDETCLPRACGKLDSGRHSQCDQAWHAYGESNARWTGYTLRTPFPAWLCEVALRGAADPAEADREALARQALNPYAFFQEPLAIGLVRRYQADAGVDAMVASRKQTQALRGLIEQL